MIQRGSNIDQLEGQHYESPFGPLMPGGGNQWIQIGDPVAVVEIAAEKGGIEMGQRKH